MRSISTSITILASLLLAVSNIPGQTTTTLATLNSRLTAIRNELRSKVSSKQFPSVSVGVVKSGRVVWRESFGFADLENKIPATPDTIYALGSLSKSITGTAVFKLYQDGKLDLGKPINTYLTKPTIDYHGRDPDSYKVFHLLNMAAGIPHYWRYCYANDTHFGACGNDFLSQASFSAFEPGETHLYSNLSFGLAALMVEDVTKMSFADFLRAEILAPAGMKRTFAHYKDIPTKSVVLAKPYRSDGSRAPEFQFEPFGGGGLFSTVNDLLRYGSMHIPGENGRRAVLTSKTLAENHRVRAELPNGYYANGWGVLPLPGKNTTLLSNGAIEGAASSLLVLPEAETVIVVLINKTVGNDTTDEIGYKVADALFPGYRSDLDALIQKVAPQFAESPFMGDASLDGDYRGFLQVQGKNRDLTISIIGKEITVEVGNQPVQTLTNVIISSGTVSGDLKVDIGSGSDQVSDATVTFRHSKDSLTGYIALESLKPRPDSLIAYFLSAKRVTSNK